ncbi:carbohydrate ABC transporter permease [Pseudoflavonifractor phocaeensis]|mgnify:CR=1 FL=1|uniref:carbohydrate ABC transporter permease n=1 Tax=Pseudoflavonifractor phocaeensis TaxID=1870988 RepID=UPI002108AA22|nr:sugar ABC transporter permease [Pseudoflavonifractor phocaeensis]MCQ4862765.1 sugar ABC transporter permease [Pseudoflavonifractor phocaeensis]
MRKRKENLTGYVFVAPALIVFLVFVAFPFFFSLFLSLTEWNFLSGWGGIQWKGLENFAKLAGDQNFRQAVVNTVIYTVATVPVSILIALVLAYVLNGKVYLKKTLRLAFFIPYISNMVALAAVFKFMFRDDGIINNVLLNVFHLQEVPRWLSNSELNKIPIILILIWTAVGYELIVYMAALQNVPKELYEAGKLDGATGFKQFVHITFPMISPTTFYLVVVRMIAAFKVFSAINIITLGTATRGNTSLVVEIYQDAFQSYKFGYASAEAVVLFAIILAITLFNFWGQKKWVHY